MRTKRDTPGSSLAEQRRAARVLLDELDVRPLSARSLLLSFLLGTDPPDVPAARLVSFGEMFGLRGGTVRTALSRMVAAGEATTDDHRYQLAGRLLDRQRELFGGQRDITAEWDGSWWTAIVLADHRSATDRRRFRSAMIGSRLGELRPDIWMRPANAAATLERPDVLVTRGPLTVGDERELTDRLWDTAAIEQTSARLLEAIEPLGEALHDPAVDLDEALPLTFEVSTACVRHLRVEPQLPDELASMPVSRRLRSTYRTVNDRFRATLDAHLRTRSPETA